MNIYEKSVYERFAEELESWNEDAKANIDKAEKGSRGLNYYCGKSVAYERMMKYLCENIELNKTTTDLLLDSIQAEIDKLVKELESKKRANPNLTWKIEGLLNAIFIINEFKNEFKEESEEEEE